MAKTKISEFSSTPGNNTDIDGINIAEGCAPSGINNAIRELMSQLKDFQAGTAGDSFNGPVGTTTAAAGAFTTLSASGAVTLSAGTANGVAYLNGSKVLTTGSALTFDGTNLGVGTASPTGTTNYSALVLNGTTGGWLRFWSGGTPVGSIFANSTDGLNVETVTATPVIFKVNGSEQMRLTSTGLGIGTSSPSAKLQAVSGDNLESTAIGLFTANNGSQSVRIGYNGIYQTAAQALKFGTNNAEQMQLSSAGNLGLGVTPSAWLWPNGTAGALQLQSGAAFSGYNASTYVSQNWYYNAGEKYIANGFATRYDQANGTHVWRTAPSGTAGNAISFTQAMTLDASGNLGVGTTSPGNRLHVTGSNGDVVRFAGATKNLYLSLDTSGYGLLSGANQTGAGFYVHDTSSYVSILTSSTERARIDSSGNLLLSTTSQFGSGKLSVSYLGASQQGINIRDGSNQSGSAYMVFGSASGVTQGTITNSGGTGVAYNTSSDYRLKTLVGEVTGAGARIDALNPVEFDWNVNGQRDRGFFAHQFQAVYPNSVTGNKDAVDADGNPVYQSMQAGSSEVIADLVAEIKSLRARVAALESN